MKNMIKKIAVLALCMITGLNSGAYGVHASGSGMDAYAADVIGDMLMINGYENPDDFILSNGIEITDIENPAQTDKRLYFVLDGSEIIGTLTVECIDGTYYSSFYLGADQEIREAYAQNKAFSLFSNKGCLIMRTDTENQVIETDNFVDLDVDSLNYPETVLTRVKGAAHICCSADGYINSDTEEMLSASSGAYTVTNIYVPFVKNEIGPTGKYICWAASVASISNYRIGTKYTAISLYNRVWAVINGCDTEDYPVGTTRWIGFAFAINNLEYTYEENALTGARVSSILSADRPICMCLSGTDGIGEKYGHTVILEGIYIGARNFYMLVDSNVTENEATGNVVTVSVTDDALNNGAHFVYTYKAITYNKWKYTFY